MTARARVVWKPGFLAEDETIRILLEDAGDEIAGLAQDLAPRRTGDLADSIVSEVGVEETDQGPKLVAKVYATDFKAPWWEFGTVLHEARPFLGTAAMQVIGNLH